jgi:hypothetical protein
MAARQPQVGMLESDVQDYLVDNVLQAAQDLSSIHLNAFATVLPSTPRCRAMTSLQSPNLFNCNAFSAIC